MPCASSPRGLSGPAEEADEDAHDAYSSYRVDDKPNLLVGSGDEEQDGAHCRAFQSAVLN